MLNEAQIKKLDDLLKFYDKYFYVIHESELEGYKWEAINKFQTEKDQNFLCALKLAFEEGANLLYRTNRDTLIKLIDNYPYDMNKLFLNLIDDNKDDLESRIKTFLYEIEKLINRETNRKWQKLLVCDAMTCLAIIKPDEYYLYRPFVFEDAYLYFYDVKFKGNPIEKAFEFHDLCDVILGFVSKKDDFLAKYKSYLKQNKEIYHSDIYTLVNCDDIFTGGEFEETYTKEHAAGEFNPMQDMIKNENQRHIGELGEKLVYKKLTKEDPMKKLDHVSLRNNDSPYDIKYDKTYIEVKTFSYQKKKNPSFYISQEEVKFSIKKRKITSYGL